MRSITPDQVEAGLREEEAIIARARARQMALLELADVMQLPLSDGSRSLREWLSGRIDVSGETARRLTTTARRLQDAPELAKELSAGQLTFDRAEAMSRIPPEHRHDRLRGFDIQGLRRLAARHRRLTSAGDVGGRGSQHLNIQPNLDESRWDIWGELEGYGGAVVSKVLTEEADRIPELPDGERMGLGYRRAVALTTICEEARSENVSTPLVTVFVDELGAEIEAGPAVAPSILDKIACSGSLEVITTGSGQPLARGRRSRVIPGRLRRFVLHRDGGCTADGCTSRYRLEPHHIVPWSEGGPTDPDNLTTLCWFHHHVVVHQRGYRIDSSLGMGRIRFIGPEKSPPQDIG